MIGLDTNILVRYFIRDDAAQFQSAADLLERQLTEREPGWVNVVALVETLWVLSSRYGLPKRKLIEVLEYMLQVESLVLQNEPQVYAALKSFRADKGTFSDLLIGQLNAAVGCNTTLTFDQKASRLPTFTLIPTGTHRA